MARDLTDIIVILNEPRYPENIGASARCLKNMGFSELRIVNPRNWHEEKILKMATHEAADIVHSARLFDHVLDAVADLHLLAGTTARTGRKRRPTHTPKTVAQKIISYPVGTRIGIMFGSEKWGLRNDDLGLCDWVITIPAAGFSSINLAQSVMIICYEIRLACGDKKEIFRPGLASIREKEGMFEHMEQVFEAIGLYEKQTRSYWLHNARRLFKKKDLTSRDVKTIRGFLRQVLWAVKNG